MIAERLPQLLDTLGLADVQPILDTHLERVAKEEMTYAEFLAQLLECEASARRERLLQTRTRMARLPAIKTLDQFDFGFQPSIDQRQIREMQTLRFLHDHSNVVFLGPPGVGKTHLSIALAVEAIQSGHRLLHHRLRPGERSESGGQGASLRKEDARLCETGSAHHRRDGIPAPRRRRGDHPVPVGNCPV